MLEAGLHDLIGDIYDAALAPELPESVIAKAAAMTGSTVAMVDVVRKDTIQNHGIWGCDPALGKIGSRYFHENPFVRRLHLFAPGRATSGYSVASFEDIAATAMFHEFLAPAGTVHLLQVTFSATPACTAGLSLWRPLEADPHGESEIGVGQVLARHMRRAFQFSRNFHATAGLSSQLEVVLDRLHDAYMLIDANGRLLHANPSAMTVISKDQWLHLRRERIAGVGKINSRNWRALLSGLGPTDGPATGAAVALYSAEASTLLLRAVPLRPPMAETWGVRRDRALGLIMIAEPECADAGLSPEVATTLGLTDAETELARALLGGERIGAYARRRGRSVNTVKTHLASLFAKTETHRQADLLRLLDRGRRLG